MARVVDVKIEDHSEEIRQAAKEQTLAWLEAIGQDAASTAAFVAPVDTGRLKNSIDSAVVEDEQAVYIGTNVEYAPYQEFGTSKGVPARHFLQFGATAHQADYREMLARYLRE